MEHVDKVPRLLRTPARKHVVFVAVNVAAVLNDLVRHAMTRVSDDTGDIA